jgi:aconitase B
VVRIPESLKVIFNDQMKDHIYSRNVVLSTQVEMKDKASICISTDDTLVQSLKLAKAHIHNHIHIMINKIWITVAICFKVLSNLQSSVLVALIW